MRHTPHALSGPHPGKVWHQPSRFHRSVPSKNRSRINIAIFLSHLRQTSGKPPANQVSPSTAGELDLKIDTRFNRRRRLTAPRQAVAAPGFRPIKRRIAVFYEPHRIFHIPRQAGGADADRHLATI
jgi:hypothetical protein